MTSWSGNSVSPDCTSKRCTTTATESSEPRSRKLIAWSANRRGIDSLMAAIRSSFVFCALSISALLKGVILKGLGARKGYRLTSKLKTRPKPGKYVPLVFSSSPKGGVKVWAIVPSMTASKTFISAFSALGLDGGDCAHTPHNGKSQQARPTITALPDLPSLKCIRITSSRAPPMSWRVAAIDCEQRG